MGIIGLGNIGGHIARMASALGFKVIYHNRSRLHSDEYEYVASKEEVFRRAEVILPVMPVTESTRQHD